MTDIEEGDEIIMNGKLRFMVVAIIDSQEILNEFLKDLNRKKLQHQQIKIFPEDGVWKVAVAVRSIDEL